MAFSDEAIAGETRTPPPTSTTLRMHAKDFFIKLVSALRPLSWILPTGGYLADVVPMAREATRAQGKPGIFITFEGGEGSGKSSTLALLAEELRRSLPICVTREPGGSSIGPALRSLILSTRTTPLTDECEALLLAADRAQHAEEVIRPALNRGEVVLCDRYLDSSVAYQGAARGLGVKQVADLSMWATHSLVPDATLLFDLEPKLGLARRHSQGEVNRLDLEDVGFHNRVREAFLALAVSEPGRFFVIDAGEPQDAVLEEVTQIVKRVIAAKRTF